MSGSIRLVPLGGLGEIGMNCLCIEQNDRMVMVDCGVTFPNRTPGIDVIHPAFHAIAEQLPKLEAVVITHGHEDHIGALPYLLQHRNVPVYGPEYALELARERLREHELSTTPTLSTVRPGDVLEVAGMRVEPIRVTHSIPDSTALALWTRAGLVVHSGDFKVDLTPTDGEHFDADRLRALGDAGVRLLLSDSTNVDNEGWTGSEATVADALQSRIANQTGRLVIGTFASNVHRLRSVLSTCRALRKRVLLLGRSVLTHRRIAEELDMLERDLPVFVNPEVAMELPRTDLVMIATGSQGEPRAALSKLASRAYPHLWLDPGDEVIFSSRVIPGRELEVHALVDAFERSGVRVWQRHDDPDLHVSGHACREEQRRMLSLIRPRSFVPVHGTFRHLQKHAALAREMGVNDTLVALNGDCIALSPDTLAIDGQWPVGRVHIQGGRPVSDQALRDRSLMSEVGIAVVSLHVDARGTLVETPALMTRGLFTEDVSQAIRDEAIAEVEIAVERAPVGANDETLHQAACVALRKKLSAHLGYRPLVYALLTRTSA